MSAPASFPFFPDDFLAGTMDLSNEEIGAYMRLLCHQWNRGSIPVQPEKQQRLAGGEVSADVIGKFKLCEDGVLRNERMELEREKQRKFRDSQADNGRKSGEARRAVAEHGLNRGSFSVGTQSNPPVPVPVPVPVLNTTPIPPDGQPALELEPVNSEMVIVRKRIQPQSEVSQIYAAYPRHVGKIAAVKAISAALTKVTFQALLEAVTAYAKSQEGRPDTEHIPHPATWFNSGRWTDDRKEWEVWKTAGTLAPAAPRRDAPGHRYAEGPSAL